MNIKSVVAASNELGESLFWSAASGTVCWIDCCAPTFHRFNPQSGVHEVTRMQLKPPVGMVALTTDPRVIAASCSAGIVLYQLDSNQSTVLAVPESGRDGIAYNDAKVSPDGRLWAGTYDVGEVEPRGTLWAIQRGRAPHLIDSGFAVVNGPAFAPDGRVMYVSDSTGRRILAYDVTSSAPSRRRVFATMTAEEGLPDGLTVDAEGALWCAHWAGGRVTRFAPTGERLMMISLPVLNVTSVAFGGEDLRTLYITTAWYGLNSQQRTNFAESGNLFAAEPGVRGLPPTPLALPFVS